MSDIFILYLWVSYLFSVGSVAQDFKISDTVYIIFAPIMVPVAMGIAFNTNYNNAVDNNE